MVAPDDWLDDFENLDFDEKTREMILHENAERVFNL
ncbi:hypothetical protein [Halobellus sp. Atlit-38R]|nr:hypothetical protein [Halobellus sp. Atlit-38R]